MGELGNCRICGKEAAVLYPLLPGNPAFCHEHHNQRDAGLFGCDLSGPDDFDLSWEEMLWAEPLIRRKGLRNHFTWTTKEGVKYLLKELTDSHLQNIITYLKRKIATLPPFEADPEGNTVSTEQDEEHWDYIISILKDEQQYRKKHKIRVGPPTTWKDLEGK